jgi:hypothetical protein
VQASSAGPAFSYHGGATLILGPEGEIRCAIVKSVVGRDRLERRRQFLTGEPDGELAGGSGGPPKVS